MPKSVRDVRSLAVIGRGAAGVAALSLAGVALLTVVDVFAGNVIRRPIVGAYEIVETGMAFVVFLGLPEIFRRDENITVDLADHFVGRRILGALRLFGALASAAFTAIMAYAMLGPATDAARYGDVKADTAIPLTVLWAPALVGLVLCFVVSLFALFRPASRARRR